MREGKKNSEFQVTDLFLNLNHILFHVISQECDDLSSNYPSPTLTAVCWLIRPVAAVVLGVTFPPERNALVVLAHKLQQEEET